MKIWNPEGKAKMQGFLKEHVNQAGSWNKDFNFTTHFIINEPPPEKRQSTWLTISTKAT